MRCHSRAAGPSAWLFVAACGLGLACGGDDPTETTGAAMSASTDESGPAVIATVPVIESIVLRPANPRPGERLEVQVSSRGGNGNDIRYEYEWKVNGRSSDLHDRVFHVEGETGKGSTIEVKAVAFDGESRSEPAEAWVRIGNSPPVLHGLIIEPLREVSAGHDVAATPKASDPDGDELRFDYRWDVNGETVATEGSVLSSSHYGRGDRIAVTVTASDGQDESNQISSEAIPVVNSDPKITSTPGSFDEFGRFIYPLQVEDPDGDSNFRYRLAEGPEGMEIDIVDGTVRWTPREDQAGKHPVKVEVSDSEGGKGIQSFMVTLAFEDPTADAPPAAADAR